MDNRVPITVSGKCGMDEMNGQPIVLMEIKDGNITSSDTVIVENNSFTIDSKMDTTCIRTIKPASGRIFEGFDVVLEMGSGNIKANIDKDGNPKVEGSPLNDKLQKRYDENLKFKKELEVARNERSEKEKKLGRRVTDKENEQYAEVFDKLIQAELENTLLFIKENMNNPLGEYYFYKTYTFMPSEKKQEMMNFATDKIKKAYNSY